MPAVPTPPVPSTPLLAVALAVVAALPVAPVSAAAQHSPPAAAAAGTRMGFSVERLARIDSAVQRAVDAGEIAGAVALVWRDGQPVYEGAFGWADREAGRRMTPDAVFRIASQTKALTSVAVMQLAEEGRLALGDPVGRYIPAFQQTTVAVRTDTGRAVVPARRPITVRDLLTHAAGISYGGDALVADLYAAAGLGREAGYGWYTADKDEPVCTTIERLAGLPFVVQPGTRFVYGYATDVLGCLVERVAGRPLDVVLRDRITGPLGMGDTHFFLPPEKRGRLAAVYTQSDDGLARSPDGARGQGHYVDGPRRSFSGGAGLVSTAGDYARFLQMLLDGGTLDTARVLGPRTVALMTTDHLDTLYTVDGMGFGLGFEVVERAGAGGRVESVGTFGWGGAYGSTYAVDPVEGLVMILLTQQIPNSRPIMDRFRLLVYQALVEPRAGARP